MMDQVYRKIGKRYKPIGQEFTGFPLDGIWLVQNGRQSMSCLISSNEKVPIHALEYRLHARKLCLALMRRFSEVPHSWDDIAKACCDYFAEAAGMEG